MSYELKQRQPLITITCDADGCASSEGIVTAWNQSQAYPQFRKLGWSIRTREKSNPPAGMGMTNINRAGAKYVTRHICPECAQKGVK